MTPSLPHPFVEDRDLIRRAEEAAASCLKFCQRGRKFSSSPLPIPVETWVESPLKIAFEVSAITPINGHVILGLAYLRERRMVVNESLCADDSRLRFTTAHELGHLEMHAAVADEWTEHDEDPEWAFRRSNPYERQADRFAAAFLMPPALLAREFFQICDDRGLNAKNTIVELMTGSDKATDLWKTVFLPEVCRRFGVSRAAALFRLSDLRLFDNAPLMLTRHAIQFLEVPT